MFRTEKGRGMTLSARSPRCRALVAAGALCVGLLAVAGPAASAAQSTGWIRLAHLSPNTPPVDVYLYSFGDPTAQMVIHHVAYGTLSSYLTVGSGEYTVAMRAAGAAASSPPVVSAGITVLPNHAYMIAGMGPAKGLRLQVLRERLTAPPGKAEVQVIQASLRQHLVTVRGGGHVLSRQQAFGTVTSYHLVSPGTMTVTAAGTSESGSRVVTLAANTVHTLVVLDGAGHLEIASLEDAAGSRVLPAGGPATGLGGMAPRPAPSPVPWLVTIGGGLMVALAGAGRLRRKRGAAAGR